MISIMTISAHLLLAVLLLITAITVAICETTLRRRIRNCRVLQLFSIGTALVLVFLNVLSTNAAIPSAADTLVIVASVASLCVQLINTAIGWLPAPQAGQRTPGPGDRRPPR